MCVCVSFINAGSRNKSPPPAPPRSCSSTPPRPTPNHGPHAPKRRPERRGVQKFVQPFVPDGRPVVYVEKDGSADITTFDGRLAANVARSNVGCKTDASARRAWTSRVVRRNNLKFVKICD